MQLYNRKGILCETAITNSINAIKFIMELYGAYGERIYKSIFPWRSTNINFKTILMKNYIYCKKNEIWLKKEEVIKIFM